MSSQKGKLRCSARLAFRVHWQCPRVRTRSWLCVPPPLLGQEDIDDDAATVGVDSKSDPLYLRFQVHHMFTMCMPRVRGELASKVG